MRRALSTLLLSVAAAALTAACATSHEMASIPPTPRCRSTASTSGLQWRSATEARDVRLNEAWCRTVAPPKVVADPGSGARAWTEVDTLAVFGWNMWVGGGDLVGFLRDEVGLDCSGAEHSWRAGARPFALLLQEVYRRVPDLPPEPRRTPVLPWRIDPDPRPGATMDIEAVAEACGLALVYVPSARNGSDPPGRTPEDKGNAILASVPLRDPVAIELPFEAGRKVAVAVTLRSPGGEPLRIVSVHLDVASTLWRTLVSGNGTRRRQVEGLIAALGSLPRASTLAGGDFNTWSADESALLAMEAVFPDIPRDATNTRGGLPADHFFFGGSPGGSLRVVPGSYRVVGDAHGSDHHARAALIAEIRE